MLKSKSFKKCSGLLFKEARNTYSLSELLSRDSCETCMRVLEYSVYAAPVLGNTCYVGFLHGNVLQDCLLYESLQIYTMGIFTEIHINFVFMIFL